MNPGPLPYEAARYADIAKVREIYKLGLKHGFKLAALVGPHGVYTESDVALIRTMAQERLAELKETKKPKSKTKRKSKKKTAASSGKKEPKS